MAPTNDDYEMALAAIKAEITIVSDQEIALKKLEDPSPEQTATAKRLGALRRSKQRAFKAVATAQAEALAAPANLRKAITGLVAATSRAEAEVAALNDLKQGIAAADKVVQILTNLIGLFP